MKIKLSELRTIIREELYARLEEFVSKEMPAGSSWKTKNGKGWAAKNSNGVTNYWYGDNEEANKKAADEFRRDTSRRPETKNAA